MIAEQLWRQLNCEQLASEQLAIHTLPMPKDMILLGWVEASKPNLVITQVASYLSGSG
ncbi:hypothetical protein MiSe_46460 [Microseira wollei NIES-4236]|uniref:LysR family transcriptional regulator n=1 Tax=Microseira wollei NIES-4236 TaxID=2530354 RepID=A0AAV3XC41_9CYAN|nr:hypothetical protein MiSe_46460 [Microseira wollei NIES-4236]